eukprot:2029637-Pyramimonas_sp.AAC.1
MTSRGRAVRTPRAVSANRHVAESAAYPGLASIRSDTAWPSQTSTCSPRILPRRRRARAAKSKRHTREALLRSFPFL